MTSIYTTTFYLCLIIMQYTCNKSTPLVLVTAEEELVLKGYLEFQLNHINTAPEAAMSLKFMFAFKIRSKLFPKPKRASSITINQF